jgi:outer membrane protein TolC
MEGPNVMRFPQKSLPLRRLARWLAFLAWAAAAVPAVATEPPCPVAGLLPPGVTLDTAVRWALVNNPDLIALRQQHGIAAGMVITAQTYPYNPILEGRFQGVTGPPDAGIPAHIKQEYLLLQQLELRHQGRYRRQEASAALSRTDWEIAAQEQQLAVRVARAFATAMYRQEKLRLVEATVRLNEEAASQVAKLREQGVLRTADLIVARTEVEDSRAQVGAGRVALTVAQTELRRLLGLVDEPLDLAGTLEGPAATGDAATLTGIALERRADLQARQLAIAEAQARLRLAEANRYGNLTFGPAYEFDPDRTNYYGAQLNLPIPVFNTQVGLIEQRRAEVARATLNARAAELAVRQNVQAALERLSRAAAWASSYRRDVLPALETSLRDIERLFALNEPGVDVLRVLDIRRKLLRARDVYLDALWEASQARADLAAAVGEPVLAIVPCLPPENPQLPAAPNK